MTILRLVFCLLFHVLFVSSLQHCFLKYHLVPDVVDAAPADYLVVTFGQKNLTWPATELKPSEVQNQPNINFWKPVKSGEFYTVVMMDPDAHDGFRHWLVIDIPADHSSQATKNTLKNKVRKAKKRVAAKRRVTQKLALHGLDVGKGTVVSKYIGSAPPKGSGRHRYPILLYKQPRKLNSVNLGKNDRFPFSVKEFAKTYKLELKAGNLFRAQFEDADAVIDCDFC